MFAFAVIPVPVRMGPSTSPAAGMGVDEVIRTAAVFRGQKPLLIQAEDRRLGCDGTFARDHLRRVRHGEVVGDDERRPGMSVSSGVTANANGVLRNE